VRRTQEPRRAQSRACGSGEAATSAEAEGRTHVAAGDLGRAGNPRLSERERPSVRGRVYQVDARLSWAVRERVSAAAGRLSRGCGTQNPAHKESRRPVLESDSLHDALIMPFKDLGRRRAYRRAYTAALRRARGVPERSSPDSITAQEPWMPNCCSPLRDRGNASR
jgi:hypothetical protein